MPDIAASERTLRKIQTRRKTVIRVAALFLLPLYVFSTGTAEPGSWQRHWIEGAGAFLIFLAIIGRAWCTLYIGGRKVERLVTTGPYSITRNPLYLFSFAAVAGLAAQTASVTLTMLTVVAAYAIFLPVIRQEEAILRHIHGSSFEAYYRAVPRFMPVPRLWQDAQELGINPALWRQTVLDSMFFLLLIPPIRALGWMQAAIPGFPVLELF